MATDYAAQYDEDNLENKNKQIAAVNETAEKNKQIITDNYNAQISDAEISYDDKYRVNAVQKLINERQVAESMANSGLTNSGLNRTQQTAVQLSYANNKAQLDRQKQSAIDNLNREMNAYLTEVETETTSSIASIEDTYNQNRQNYVAAMQQAEIEAAAELEAARIKAEQESGTETETPLSFYEYAYDKKDDSGNVQYRVFHLDGKEVMLQDGVNPYTRTNNKIKYSYEAENYGFFSNGYQPKGVKGHGAFTGAIGTDNIYGKEQSIWQAADGTLWYWNGRDNEYVMYDFNGDGQSNVLDFIAVKQREGQ